MEDVFMFAASLLLFGISILATGFAAIGAALLFLGSVDRASRQMIWPAMLLLFFAVTGFRITIEIGMFVCNQMGN
jgi:hypothetical protein